MRIKDRLVRLVPDRWQCSGRYWYRRARGRLDRELALVLPLVPPGATVIDVGAGQGLYSYAFARQHALVHAFEPQPVSANVVAALAVFMPNVRLYRVALSDSAGALTLYTPILDGRLESGLSSFESPITPHTRVDVEVRTLDSFAFRDISFIKIDVEGHESAVLRGALESLRRDRPMLLVEIEERHRRTPVGEVFEFLRREGYRAYFRDAQHRTRPISEYDIALHQRAWRHDVMDRRYINNFLFLHDQDHRSHRIG